MLISSQREMDNQELGSVEADATNEGREDKRDIAAAKQTVAHALPQSQGRHEIEITFTTCEH
jgi:hypothetical protein